MALTNVLRKLTQSITRPHPERVAQPSRAAVRHDGFDRVQLGRRAQTSAQVERDRSFVTSLYRELLGREPDVEGMASHMRGLANGMRHEDILHVFLTSPEYLKLHAPPAPAPAEPPAPPAPTTPVPPPAPTLPREPGAPLSTVPMRAEYANAPIDKSSISAAAKSAAAWVKQTHPEFFDKGDDRQVAFEMMSWVVGSLRAAGYDAHRVVNHPDRPVGDGLRYGSDAVVIDGHIFDVYVAWGDPGRGDPTAQDVGMYAPGRPRE